MGLQVPVAPIVKQQAAHEWTESLRPVKGGFSQSRNSSYSSRNQFSKYPKRCNGNKPCSDTSEYSEYTGQGDVDGVICDSVEETEISGNH